MLLIIIFYFSPGTIAIEVGLNLFQVDIIDRKKKLRGIKENHA